VLECFTELFERRVRREYKVALGLNLELLAQYVGFDLLGCTAVIGNKNERRVLTGSALDLTVIARP
jgi:hypothetical protein